MVSLLGERDHADSPHFDDQLPGTLSARPLPADLLMPRRASKKQVSGSRIDLLAERYVWTIQVSASGAAGVGKEI